MDTPTLVQSDVFSHTGPGDEASVFLHTTGLT